MRTLAVTASWLAVLVVSCCSHVAAAPQAWPAMHEATGAFALCCARDPDGCLWIGTEGKGVFRYNPGADEALRWSHYDVRDGLGDNDIFAVAADRQGRIWAGTRSHGVAVFNGSKWRSYGVLEGPIGERVFAIAVSPDRGDVWIGTNAGLTRYSMADQRWSHFTRRDGLPSNQIQAIAFGAKGTCYIGTLCDGIAISHADSEYRRWQIVASPFPPGRLPLAPGGAGLPTNLINAVAVTPGGTVVAATSLGLAWSTDQGKTWKHWRGRDFAEKVKRKQGGAPTGWKEPVLDGLLPEDYIASITADTADRVWLGFWQEGTALVDVSSQKVVRHVNKACYVRGVQACADGSLVIATYGQGVISGANPVAARPNARAEKLARDQDDRGDVALPTPIGPPTVTELRACLKDLKAGPRKREDKEADVLALDDDWMTQGDFYGASEHRDFRYGERFACLCAHSSPFDAKWGRDAESFGCFARTGEHGSRGEALRHWVHWSRTNDVRCLKNPLQGARRQAEWDDHKETYPMSHEGPHVYVNVRVPPGTYYLSLYFMNKDGHDGMNRLRDYVVNVKTYCRNDAEFARAPLLARGRIRDFWGGVYKTFLIKGDRNYTIQIHSNWSFNTICSAVLFDSVVDSDEERLRYRDIPRVQASYTLDEGNQLRDLHADKDEPEKLALAVLGALEVQRRQSPRGFARDSRPAWIAVARTFADVKEPDQAIRRARAHAWHHLKHFDLRDQDLQKLVHSAR